MKNKQTDGSLHCSWKDRDTVDQHLPQRDVLYPLPPQAASPFLCLSSLPSCPSRKEKRKSLIVVLSFSFVQRTNTNKNLFCLSVSQSADQTDYQYLRQILQDLGDAPPQLPRKDNANVDLVLDKTYKPGLCTLLFHLSPFFSFVAFDCCFY